MSWTRLTWRWTQQFITWFCIQVHRILSMRQKKRTNNLHHHTRKHLHIIVNIIVIIINVTCKHASEEPQTCKWRTPNTSQNVHKRFAQHVCMQAHARSSKTHTWEIANNQMENCKHVNETLQRCKWRTTTHKHGIQSRAKADNFSACTLSASRSTECDSQQANQILTNKAHQLV